MGSVCGKDQAREKLGTEKIQNSVHNFAARQMQYIFYKFPSNIPGKSLQIDYPFPIFYSWACFLYSQGLPGPPGEKGENGDVGPMVRNATSTLTQ